MISAGSRSRRSPTIASTSRPSPGWCWPASGSEFSPEQREEFVEQFKIQLSKNYGSRITRYEQEQVEILDHRLERNGDVTVRTRIDGGAADGIEVDYRLRRKDRKKDGPWMVIDVIIEGVSLVSSYRSQFAEVLGHEDPSELLKQLREKNAASVARTSLARQTSRSRRLRTASASSPKRGCVRSQPMQASVTLWPYTRSTPFL